MKKLLNKKMLSNIFFVVAIGVLIYPKSREWVMRQVAFSPSVEEVSESVKLTDYNWNLRGLNVENQNFNEFEGNVIFINFWATWCPPCRAEMPMIQKLYDDYKDKVTFVFVTNEDWDTVNSFFNKNEYQLPVYNSVGVPPTNFTETNSIPATYIIDKKGHILVSKVGSANWNSSKVRKLLDDLIK